MISFLSGEVLETFEDKNKIIFMSNNIGFDVFVSNKDIKNIIEVKKLYVYMHITDNNILLYGFKTIYAKNMFEQLITVNSVGPKAALSILSEYELKELVNIICSKNVKALKKVKGIGDAAAQKIILALEKKISSNLKDYGFDSVPDLNIKVETDEEKEKRNDIKEGLKRLGFDVKSINSVFDKLDLSKDRETLMLEALNLVSNINKKK
jgi:Holliday junction DNA helicase RuvA